MTYIFQGTPLGMKSSLAASASQVRVSICNSLCLKIFLFMFLYFCVVTEHKFANSSSEYFSREN